MAQPRAITTHPVFPPLLAMWFAALFGFGVAVLPSQVRQNGLATLGLGGLGPVAASALAAAVAAMLGWALAMVLARRGARDPRPIYAEADVPIEDPVVSQPVRRPLYVREEMAADEIIAGPEQHAPSEIEAHDVQSPPAVIDEQDGGFMILTSQRAHSARPEPGLEKLLAQFDTAISSCGSTDEALPPADSGTPDPVQAFVARQTGSSASSPLGGRMPDHQAELRAALDKLARAHRGDEG